LKLWDLYGPGFANPFPLGAISNTLYFMEFKLTTINQLKVQSTGIINSVLLFILCWILKFDLTAVYICLAYYMLLVAPSFYLHISYFLRNRNTTCKFNPTSISIIEGGKIQMIARTEIKDIVIYKSASIEKGGYPITAMEEYFFVRLFTKNGIEYDLTCLLNPHIDKHVRDSLDGVPIYIERGLFNNL
jgi:hypothetical protein